MKGQSARPGPRYQALIELLRTAETLWNASRVFFARWDLSPSQFNVLNLLYEQPGGCTQIELSRQLIMHRSNVTGLVDRLEARGLLQRQDSADRPPRLHRGADARRQEINPPNPAPLLPGSRNRLGRRDD